ncbi:hypothetical protein L195_g029046, partial [Trifolium pratense]
EEVRNLLSWNDEHFNAHFSGCLLSSDEPCCRQMFNAEENKPCVVLRIGTEQLYTEK